MKTVEEFITSLGGSIEIVEDNQYGHYPFSGASVSPSGETSIMSLALGGDVAKCYQVLNKCIQDGAEKVFISVDFPAAFGMEHDFICVHSYEDKKLSVLAIPYDRNTGEKFEPIKEHKALDILKKQALQFIED